MDAAMHEILTWCRRLVGPFELDGSDDRFHGRASVLKLLTPSGFCYLKVHRDRATWDPEVHGYEQWAPAFDGKAPCLLGVHDEEPLALLVSELAGRRMEDESISEASLQQAWHDAGRALSSLHAWVTGEQFGPCRRDGSAAGVPIHDAVEFVSARLAQDAEKAVRAGYLDDAELDVVRAARRLVRAFDGERPIPCHRDYNPANWLLDEQDRWIGVIDFEMSAWDVRVSDFSRYPQWEWRLRPDLIEAFFDGYRRVLTAVEEEQLIVAHVQYALSCILWGQQHEYLGFVREAREALASLGKKV